MNFHIEYFKEKLSKLSDEKLWEIIEELILPYSNAFDKKSINHEEVLELAIILKASNELFRNLEQIALLKHELDQASHKIK